eukprot:498095-Rhodomonas_salina.2
MSTTPFPVFLVATSSPRVRHRRTNTLLCTKQPNTKLSRHGSGWLKLGLGARSGPCGFLLEQNLADALDHAHGPGRAEPVREPRAEGRIEHAPCSPHPTSAPRTCISAPCICISALSM